jgi:hypothetical protein
MNVFESLDIIGFECDFWVLRGFDEGAMVGM